MAKNENSKNESRNNLIKCFDNVGEGLRDIALACLDDCFYFLDEIEKLKPLPKIRVSKTNPAIQKLTPAAKLIKEYSQLVEAKRGTLIRILSKNESSAADELLERLKEFE